MREAATKRAADEAPERSQAHAARDQLGTGVALPGPIRAAGERALGAGLGDVRVHDDADAARLAGSLRARAFTVGTDIGFAAGRYRPGTPYGDALIAHELAHVAQQRSAGSASEGTAERDANSGAAATLLGRTWSPVTTGLQLHRCNGDGEGGGETTEPPEPADQPAPPSPAVTPTPTPTPPPPQEQEFHDLSDVQWQPIQSRDAVLMVRGPNQSLYLLPARGLVYEPAPPPAQGTPRPQTFGVPAAGHAGAYLVRTSRGVGMLVDAGGTQRGAPNVLLPASLAFISARMGIGEITSALLSHTHADHVANFESFVQAGQVTASRVYVYPGWETARAGPLANLYRAMRAAAYTAQGFGPAWQPTPLTTRDVRGVTSTTIQVGDARFDIVTRSADLQRYVAELRAGRTGTRFADAASMLTRIRVTGAQFDITILGDIRGATLVDLHAQMGAAAFDTFFRDTRVLAGFQHHLGAVNSARDVQGLILLLRAARSADFQLSAIVQTDSGRNMDLIRQLQEAGVRVYALGEIDPAARAAVGVRTTGEVVARGADVYEPTGASLQARSRIENLTRAAEVLESHPGLIRTTGATQAEMATGLRAEAERLRTEVYARQELALGQTHARTARADYATRLAANTTAIEAVQGMEASLGTQGIRTLRRLSERAVEMQRELEAARAHGRASPRLAQLIMEVEPSFARAVLADEYGRATDARGRLRAQRRAEARLRQQVNLQRALTSGGGARAPAGARGVAVGLIALEVFNIVAPFIQYGIDQYRDQRARDFYVFLTIGTWWHEKTAPVPVRARRGGVEVPQDEDITPSALRRVWEDLPSAQQRPEADLAQPVREAQPLEALWIPPLAQWAEPQRIWDAYRLWISIHVRNINDFAAEFLDIPNPAIRRRGGFQTGEWDVRTGSVDDDGHVQQAWEHSPELTQIMRATTNTVVATTTERIEQEWARRTAREAPEPPGVWAPGTVRPPRALQLGRTRFRGGVKPVFSAIWISVTNEWEIRELNLFRFWNEEPVFHVYERERAPRGYVQVGGGDYNTASALRVNESWFDDPEDVVPIPKWYTPLYESIPVEPEYTPRQRAALDARTAGRATYYAFPEVRPSNPYRGEVHFPYLGPNITGRVFVRRSDLQEPWER